MASSIFEQLQSPQYWGESPYEPLPRTPTVVLALGMMGLKKDIRTTYDYFTASQAEARYELIPPGESVVPPVGHKSHMVRIMLDKRQSFSGRIRDMFDTFDPKEFNAMALEMAHDRWYAGGVAAGFYEEPNGSVHVVTRRIIYGRPTKVRWGLGVTQSFQLEGDKPVAEVFPPLEVGSTYAMSSRHPASIGGLARVASAETIQSIGTAYKTPSSDAWDMLRGALHGLHPRPAQ